MNPVPSDKILKRMGYFADQEGIINRYIAEEGNWIGHLQSTKNFIIDCVSRNKPKNIAILGSGWLLDVPIEYISDNCKQVYLYDIRHPRQIRHKLKSRTNVKLVSCDISGGAIEDVYKIMQSKKSVSQQLDELEITGFNANEPIDFIISVNILTQLDNLIIEYLNKLPPIENTVIEKFRSKIQSSHIKSLIKHHSAFVTDYEELIYDRNDNLLSANSLLFTELPKSDKAKEWIWQFDSQMTYYPNRKTFFKVVALEF